MIVGIWIIQCIHRESIHVTGNDKIGLYRIQQSSAYVIRGYTYQSSFCGVLIATVSEEEN